MPRETVRKTAKKNVEVDQETNQQDYSKMTAVELKKLLDTRKIEGRSKLTKKETMIKVLELFDQNPDDKESIAALVAELSTPRKKNASKSEVQEGNDDETPSSEEKPKKATKKATSNASRSKKEPSDEEKQEKPKRKPRTKKDNTESSSEEKSKEEEEEKSSSEDKPKRKPRTKKESTKSTTESSSEKSSNEDTPKKKSLSKKQKERDEELEKAGINRADFPPGTRFVKSAIGKFQVRYPKGYKEEEPESSEKEASSSQVVQEADGPEQTAAEQSAPEQSAPEHPSPLQSEPERVDYDSDATQEMPEDEISSIAAKTATKTKSKKPASNPSVTSKPSSTKSEPQQINEGKQEVEEVQKQEAKKQEQLVDLEDDPSMKEVLTLTRDILKRMKYLGREASENLDFKKSWIKTLTQLKGDFDNELGLLGASIDE
jgi:hypothetical protein